MRNPLPLRGVLLVSDMDGTLITADFTIPERNLEAIRRLRSKGGLFTVATGRANTSVERYNALLGLTTPAILYNGAAIYDLQKHAFVWKSLLPQSARDFLRQAVRLFPDIGAEVLGEGRIYVVQSNDWTVQHTRNEHAEYAVAGADDIHMGWNKVLFAGEHARLLELRDFAQQFPNGGWHFVFSDLKYFEMLPAGVSKGSTLLRLAGMLGVDKNDVMAIGDYYNDAAMIRSAAVGAAPAGAPQEIKAQAGFIAGRCEDGAVADFIEYIEDRYEARPPSC